MTTNNPRPPHTQPVAQRPPSAIESGVRATSANWIDPPFNRWGFSHVRELTRTARVAASRGQVWELPERLINLDHIVTTAETASSERSFTYTEMLHATYTDACVVVHDGRIVYEYYDVGIRRDRPHLLMSVSKSLTATLIGILVEHGHLATDGLVTDYLPELAATCWEGCTLQHLLDMRAGVEFTEHDMDDPTCDGRVIEQISGYTFNSPAATTGMHLPTDTYEWIRTLPSRPPHGGPFVYRSILIDVLAWIAEAVTGERFAELFSRLVWSQIGAEHDADLIVDSAGFPVVEGGLSASARDLARFGLMHLQRGIADGTRVVPAAWIDRVIQRDQELVDTFAVGYAADPDHPDAYYHDCWWVSDPSRGRYGGHGLGGQNLLIDRSSNSLVVKYSSWPKRTDPLLADLADRANEALFDWLGGAPDL